MKPKYITSKSRIVNCGTSLVTVISFCFGGAAMAVDNFWTGSVSTEYNLPENWSLGRVPVKNNGATVGDNFDDAVINVKTPNIATITTPVPAPRDFRIGQGANTDGRLDVKSGTASTGNTNWAFIGRLGGTGVLNLADTSATGGTLTGFGVGSGSFICDASRLYVGGGNGGAPSTGNGTLNMNTSGSLTIGSDLAIGSGTGAVGRMNVDGGTITTGGWNFIGKNENGEGGDGKLYMAGGTLTNTGRTYVGQRGSKGLIELTGASYKNINDALFIVGEDPGSDGTVTVSSPVSLLQSGGELWLGQNDGATGVLNVSAGTVTVNNWFAIARGGKGTVNQTGGTITKTGGGSVTIANFANAVGEYNISNGLLDIQNGDLIVGEGGGGSGTLTMTQTAQVKAPRVLVGTGGTVISNLVLDGGTLTTGILNGAGGGNSNVSFNGTQIVATVDRADFITNFDSATINLNGLKIDSAGKVLTVPQFLGGSGPIVKSGAGQLFMPGIPNSYTGNLTVSAGKLGLTTNSGTLTGSLTVANNATFGVNQTVLDDQLTISTATFGTSGPSSLDINLGNSSPNTAFAPAKFGTVALNGNVTLNITDALPETGMVPLVQYDTKTGTGNFVLGTLPNGVVATLNTSTAGLVSLNVTSVKLPRWDGTVNGIWDTTTQNWVDLVSNTPTTYSEGSPPLFDDNANGTKDVVLNTTVTPSLVTFANSISDYTLTGTGKISGTNGLTKSGTAALTIGTVNDYTGVTRLEGGVTNIASLGNGGVESAIGKATNAASNLVLAGGTLAYTGPTTTSDRGVTLAGGTSGIRTTNDLTLSSPIVSSAGGLTKTGPGKLTLTNPGTNTIGLLAPQGLRADGGILQFEGAGTQVNNVAGDFFIASIPDVPASVVLNNATLNVPNYLTMGRGNGNTSTVSSFTATNSTMTTGNFTTGFDNGLPNNSIQNVTVTNTTWTNNDILILSESVGSTTNMVVGGTSLLTVKGRLLLGNTDTTTANLTIQDTAGVVHTSGWLSIGNNGSGVGVVTVKNSGSLSSSVDFNVSDVGTSTGTLNVQDNASVVSTGSLYVAKNGGTTGTVNLTGGKITARRVVENGGGGISTFNFDGGTLVAGPTVDNPFITGMDSVVIKAGGGTIDTGSNANVTVNQFFADDATGGKLKKVGTGTLFMNGFSSYTGDTLVEAGTLAGIGTISGAVKVAAGANINPGANNGTLFVDSLSFTGASTVTIDIGANADTLAVFNELNLTNASLVLNGTPTLPSYIIASYGTLVGTFPAVTLPSGYAIDYNFNGNNQIAIVGTTTPFQTWIGTFFPGETNPAIIGLNADPDADGQSNLLEFALDGNPTSGTRSGKVVVKTASVGGAQTLVLSLPVRNGATFSGTTEQVATVNGITYRIQGSDALQTWNLAVGEVTGADKNTIEAGLPALNGDWTYRTFRAPGPIAGNPKSFLRAVIVSE